MKFFLGRIADNVCVYAVGRPYVNLFFKVQVAPKPLTCPRGKSLLEECPPLDDQIVRALLLPTFVHEQWRVLEALHCRTTQNVV